MKQIYYYFVIRFEHIGGEYDYLTGYDCCGFIPECSNLLSAYRFLTLDSAKTELKFINNFCNISEDIAIVRIVKIDLKEINFICN